MSLRRLALSFALFSIAFNPVSASDPEDETTFSSEITVTATGDETPADEVPLPITVVSSEEIEQAQTPSVADVIRRAPGLNVVQSSGPGSLTSVFIRGAESDHTLVLIDGVRLNSPYFGGFDFSQLTTTGLDRIEIARGPFSALWGADAVGGVINLIPGRGADGFHGSLFAEGGQDSWERYEGSFSWGSDSFDLTASGVKRSVEGDLYNSDSDIKSALVNGGWSWGLGRRVSLLYHRSDSDLGIPFSSPGSLTPERRQQADQTTLAVPFRWAVSDRWQLEMTVSKVDRNLEFSDPDDPWGFTWSRTEADTTEVRAASHHTLGRHRLSWGAEWRSDEVTDRSVFGSNLDAVDTDMTSLFAQDVWNPSNSVTVVVGARWDDADQWGSELSPRVNIGWRASGRLELRAGYGEAYRQPSVGELYFPFSGNPDLQPETSDSLELGLVWTPRIDGPFRVTLNAFSTSIDNLILFDYIAYTLENIGSADIDGVEAAFDWIHSAALTSSFQVTWLDTADDSGNELLRRPEWSGAYTIFGSFCSRIEGSATIRYVGDRPDVDPVTFETADADPFVTVDLALKTAIWDQIDITLRATNLLDEDYEEVLGYPAPGRRIIGGIRVGF